MFARVGFLDGAELRAFAGFDWLLCVFTRYFLNPLPGSLNRLRSAFFLRVRVNIPRESHTC